MSGAPRPIVSAARQSIDQCDLCDEQGCETECKAQDHTPRADKHPYTYASTQATHCAGCGEYKHTPLRIDAMGGYVCLTCIDRKLGVLLGEFGYPAPQQALTETQVQELCCAVEASGARPAATALIQAVEREHRIGPNA